MLKSSIRRLYSLLSVVAWLLLLSVAACDFVGSAEQAGVLTPTPLPLTPGATPVVAAATTTVLTTTNEPGETAVSPLRIWIPADPPGLNEADADLLVAKLMAFANSPAEMPVIVQEKALSGAGGILSYLRTGRGLADSVLPDLVLLPTEQLPTAVSEGVVNPLDEFLDVALLDDLYPAAAALAQVNGEFVGYPIALTDLTHLAYDSAVLTSTLPLRWGAFISETNGSLLLPASSYETAVLTLQLYQALGGQLVNETGQMALSHDLLAQAFTLLRAARSDYEFIVVDSLNIATIPAAWEGYRNGVAPIVMTTAAAYQPQRLVDPAPAFAPLPGPDGLLPPQVNGWVVVLTAAEDRRPLAADYLRTVISTANLAEWSAAQQLLPASPAPFALWPEPDEAYHLFLAQQLAIARPNPLTAGGALTAALQDAAFEVLSLDLTPEGAALQVLTEVMP